MNDMRLANVQALRGVAALLVVLFHSRHLYGDFSGVLLPLQWIANAGYTGVDLFFAISGFIMWHTCHRLQAEPRVAGLFLLRRCVRIFAGYWPALLLTVAVFWLAGWAFPSDVNWRNTILLTTIKLKQLAIPYSWSLTFELYFYALFAVILLMSPRRRLLGVLLFAALIMLGKWVLTHWFLIGYINRLFYHPLMLEFLWGMLAWQLVMRCTSRSIWVLVYCTVLALLVFGSPAEDANVLWRVMTTGTGLAGVLALACWLEKQGTVAPGWMVAWGDASYAVYLLHFLAISIVERTGCLSLLMDWPLWLREVCWLSGLAGFCLFCLLFFRTVERPLYRRLSRGLHRRAAVPLDAG